MKRRSPTLEGFQALFRLPALGLAEIAWRWSFGLAVTALLAFSFREYLSTLPVTAAEMFLLQTRQPALMLQVIARILQGSAPRAVTALMVLALAVTLAWIVRHPLWGAIGLPVLARLYVRQVDVQRLPQRWPFHTKLELAKQLVLWIAQVLRFLGRPLWFVFPLLIPHASALLGQR